MWVGQGAFFCGQQLKAHREIWANCRFSRRAFGICLDAYQELLSISKCWAPLSITSTTI
jgi:hypothetical protein